MTCNDNDELEVVLEKILERVEGWVKFSEAKIIAFITVIGGSIVFTLEYIYDKDFYWAIVLYIYSYIFFSFISFLLLIVALLPVRTLNIDKKINLIYFSNIIDLDLDYGDYISKLKGADIKSHVADQIIKLSYIADRKFYLFSFAMILYSFGVCVPFGIYCANKCFYRAATERRRVNE